MASSESETPRPKGSEERLNAWRSTLAVRRGQLTEEAERQMTILGLKINEVTGYKEVERLKDRVHEREDDLRVLRDASKAAKTAYDEAVTVRAEAARDVNALLERKHSWTDADVSRFTTLVRSDHSSNHAVHLTSSQLKEAELAVDKAFSDLTQAILERYHEEQVWSDKIRNVSTWAGVVGLLVNFVVFIGAIAVVEPWKRRRLVERLEERMTGMMEKVEGAVELLAHRFDDLESGSGLPQTSATQTPDVLHASGSQDSPPPVVLRRPLWTVALDWLPRDLESIAQPSPERDLAVVGLCGAAGGAALVACLSWLLRG